MEGEGSACAGCAGTAPAAACGTQGCGSLVPGPTKSPFLLETAF